MSRKTCLLTQKDVPKYIKEIVKRLNPIPMRFEDEEGTWTGYTFRLDAKWKCGYESQLETDCEKLARWCRSWHAYAKIIKYAWWQDEISTQQKALKQGWRNHAYLVISDPAAQRFEKDKFYHNK